MNWRKGLLWFVLMIMLLAISLTIYAALLVEDFADIRYPPGTLPLAILGDSDSHSYQDDISFKADTPQRGGDYRASTFQWIEILARLRSEQINPGPWSEDGTRRLFAKIRQYLDLPYRMPHKRDYRFNFAMSGAVCDDLLTRQQQVNSFIQLMQSAPTEWQHGVVVIRMGINDLGTRDMLTRAARDPNDILIKRKLNNCRDDLVATVAALKQHNPTLTVILVGLFNNSHWAPNLARWQSALEQQNIARVVAQFDQALQQLQSHDKQVIYFDDNAWFQSHWGSRDAEGRPAYRDVVLSNGFRVSNSQGDAPEHATLQDGHAGLVWNALWAQALLASLSASYPTGPSPITDHELLKWLSPLLPDLPSGDVVVVTTASNSATE